MKRIIIFNGNNLIVFIKNTVVNTKAITKLYL